MSRGRYAHSARRRRPLGKRVIVAANGMVPSGLGAGRSAGAHSTRAEKSSKAHDSYGWVGGRVLLFVAGFILTAATAAFAYWVIGVIYGPTNYALAQATSLSAPTLPTATVGGSGTITVGWTLPGSQLPGVQYQVTRTSGPGSPTTVCTVASTVRSCPDTGLTAGAAYGYSVVGFLDNWQTTAITTSTTTATPTLSIALSSGPYTAGSPITVTTITAKNGSTTDTTYSGAKTITWSGLANSPSPSNHAPSYPATTSVTFTSGVATLTSPFTAYAAGSNTLMVTDANATSVTGSVTFTVSPATAASLALGAATTTPTAGATDNLTTTALDTYGNTATSYSGSKSLTFTGASPIGSHTPTVTNASGTATNFGTSESITFASGVATVSGSNNGAMVLYKAGRASIVVSDGSINNGSGLSVTVALGAVNKLAFTTVPSGNQTASATATIGAYQVQEQDSFGNPVAAGSTVTLTLSTTSGATGHTPFFTPTSGGSSGAAVTIGSGQSTTANFYYSDTLAGTPTATASATGITNNGTTSPTIVAAAVVGLGMVVAPSLSSGTPLLACGTVSASYTCNVTGVGSGGHVGFYAEFLDSFGNPGVYSTSSPSTITETGQAGSGSVVIAANASSSSPSTLTASHTGSSQKTSTLTFGSFTLTINVNS